MPMRPEFHGIGSIMHLWRLVTILSGSHYQLSGLFTRWSRSRPACCLPWGQLSKFPNPRSKTKLKTKPEQIWYQKRWVDQQKKGKHWGHAIYIYILYLVGGLGHFLFFHILGTIIPTDELIFFRGMNIVVTSQRSRRRFYGHWLGVTIPE